MPKRNPVKGQEDEVRPWGAVSAVPHEDGIELVRDGRRRLIKVTGADAALVWAVLGECDGFQPLERVVQNVCARFPDRDPQTVRDVLADLLEEGAVTDSREIFRTFHRVTESPQPYGRGLTADEIIAHTRSPRLPVIADGDSYELEQLPSELARLQARRRSCLPFLRAPDREAGAGARAGQRIQIRRRTRRLAGDAVGGALYPLKIYVIVARGDDDLAAGYYEYDPEPPNGSTGSNPSRRRLVRIDAPLDEETLGYAFDTDAAALPHVAPAAIVVAGDMLRDPIKYSNRGYRYMLIEAGLVVQNVVLAAAELGVESLPYGGFRDAALAAELGMDRVVDGDPDRVRALVTVAVGYQDDAPAVRADELVDEMERRPLAG